MIDCNKLYNENAEYRLYVDKCAKDHGERPEETLKRLTIQEVGKMYAEKASEEVSKAVINVRCGGGC